MTDNDRNARNEETERLMSYQRDRDLQRRGVKIDEAIQGITDDDRKMLINKSLRKVDSALIRAAARVEMKQNRKALRM